MTLAAVDSANCLILIGNFLPGTYIDLSVLPPGLPLFHSLLQVSVSLGAVWFLIASGDFPIGL